MRGPSAGLLGLGVILIVLAALNHFVLKSNPIAHTSIIVGVIGLILAVGGFAMSRTGMSKAS